MQARDINSKIFSKTPRNTNKTKKNLVGDKNLWSKSKFPVIRLKIKFAPLTFNDGEGSVLGLLPARVDEPLLHLGHQLG